MCGIAGVLQRGIGPNEWDTVLRSMTETLRHRGPDDSGIWRDPTAGVGLGHRRLSIIDLSPAGHQPMLSRDGRYIVVFNGEIYNFRSLRDELEREGCSFRGHSDTEVLLASVSQWGLEKAIGRFFGMFAFALWDRQQRSLALVRDRLGKKPLYYGRLGRSFVFASELKAFRLHPHFKAEIDRDILALYLRHNYVPAPYSIYKGILKLSPGTILTVSPDEGLPVPQPTAYWSAKEVAEHGVSQLLRISEEDAVEQLDALLRDTVRVRMESDVPLGAFLSGGIDSSLVVSLMQSQSMRPVKTFTIGFNEEAYNEAPYAKRVADHLGTEHTDHYVSSQEAIGVIPSLPGLYDEPFADSSQIPVALLCALARRHVTVSLSGDGGDEGFAGYDRYLLGKTIWKAIGWLPPQPRAFCGKLIRTLSVQRWQNLISRMRYLLPGQVHTRGAGHKLYALAEVLAAPDSYEIYHQLVSHWKQPDQLVPGSREPQTALTARQQRPALSDFIDRMMYLDTVSYLPDDLLVKVDRASMGVSLEVRAPLLDHRVIEFGWRLPLSMKVRKGQGKWILRRMLERYVPRDLFERPKMGFGVPLDSWLRGPLRDWAESLLDESRLRREGFFNPAPIREKWREHLSGHRDWHYHLWDVLMFQAWTEKWR